MRFILLNNIQYRVESTGLDLIPYKLYKPGRKTPFDGLRSVTQPGVIIVMCPGKTRLFFDEKTMKQLPQGPTQHEAALPAGSPVMDGTLAFRALDHADKAGLASVLFRIVNDPATRAHCNVKDVVAARVKDEPYAGFISDCLTYELCCGIVLQVIDRRVRRTGTAVVTVNGAIVLHQTRNIYISGEWERVLQRATDELGLGDIPAALADVTGDREAIAA